MTLGRNGSPGTVVGTLSLVAVSLALYLSPVGTPGNHPKSVAAAQKPVIGTRPQLGRMAGSDNTPRP